MLASGTGSATGTGTQASCGTTQVFAPLAHYIDI